MSVTLTELAAVAEAHAEATGRARAAAELRAVAAWRAKQAGATYAQLAAVLGMARANVVPLVRRGEALSAGSRV